MIDGSHIALFLSAAVLLALTPGPGMLYVLGRTLHGGTREGVLSTFGTVLGGTVHIVAAAFGISAILATSAVAFSLVRYAGAAYLIYLGVKMLRTRSVDVSLRQGDETVAARGSFAQGITTEILNPKTALFFLSFLPQFVVPAHGHVVEQFFTLGTTSVLLNAAADLVAVFLAGSLAHRMRNNPAFTRRQRTTSGVGMIGLGVYVAASK